MKRTVRVLAEDILNGHRGFGRRCPVALAVNRDLADLLTGPLSFGMVGTTDIFLMHGPRSPGMQLAMPARAQEFVTMFDCDRPVFPFEFEVEVPG